MNKELTIKDKKYAQWVEELCTRYRLSNMKATGKTNREMLKYYRELGRDIVELHAELQRGKKFLSILSRDLKKIHTGGHVFFRNEPTVYKELLSYIQAIHRICPTACGAITNGHSTSARNCSTSRGAIPARAVFLGEEAWRVSMYGWLSANIEPQNPLHLRSKYCYSMLCKAGLES